ncbi:MAG: tRNA pseudouridine(38-40) synthase TruA [Nitrospirae bacterium]|nr:tRNA pseudouridine(38-40) synthase TruA [Nitrospirota bacterium]MBI3352324.1 tRNA pseudouridine(38-40) synthase TruA [Nitrospirota bacterium]
MTRNVRLTISYNGTPFHGWQVQPDVNTIQGTLIKVIEKITSGKNVNLIGAGRTDAGVHALGQVANFKTEKTLTEKKWKAALNGLLPPEIVVWKVEFVPDGFHSRYTAIDKTYAYHIGFQKSPFLFDREWTFSRPLKLPAMKKALSFLAGKHDFTSFASSLSESETKICHLKKYEIVQNRHSLIFRLTANRFLTHMVRNIVGTLVEVGLGKIKPAEIKQILELKDRKKAGPTAPPHGLYLVEVKYRKRLSEGLASPPPLA